MCGIAGYFGKNKHAPNKSCISECLNLMHNRGPDARGQILKSFRDQALIFLHSRLSIIDLTKDANQPFEDENGILTFNGEIYNFIELKNFVKKKRLNLKLTLTQKYF